MTSRKDTGIKNNSSYTEDPFSKKNKPNGKPKQFFDQIIFLDWCKACGICIAFCPKHVFEINAAGKSVVKNSDDCIGCRFCEVHCPDFAITIKERFIDRRKKHVEE
jgi:2-oxoglutarate ferredoxin oxidoreductase subunit delta